MTPSSNWFRTKALQALDCGFNPRWRHQISLTLSTSGLGRLPLMQIATVQICLASPLYLYSSTGLERLTTDQDVAGSNPARGAKQISMDL